ncbi:alpha/beta fold hydrolase [Aestuariibacter halophilus]|uniref:Alpha/beta fold hydrolase n=1 Tax=Fluctibacter halophilus TaxID=226011 RepID=A0ABS8G9N2_9ALTE|nr:alpha/beta fold hydrolase [Aestuariibacter halophilus]MCC2616901.1 alpha/beta fold hydrolase [Aestuariibacter halophilus]
MTVKETPLTLTTQAGHTLSARQFSVSASQQAIVIAPAMGVEQSYYFPVARWLAEQGFEVLTFDYHGMGASQQGPLKHHRSSILDWARQDASAALAHIRQQIAGDILWLGHSLGGQVFPLVNDIQQVQRVVTVASGTGYWRHNAPPLRRKVWWFWFVLVPVLVRIYGYFPGKKLGMVGDLPAPVIQQWKRWCMHPEYCVGTEDAAVRQSFDTVNVPICALALEDDEMLSDKNISALFALFGSKDKSLHVVHPDDFGLDRIGHLGLFRAQFEDTLWPQVLLPALTSGQPQNTR